MYPSKRRRTNGRKGRQHRDIQNLRYVDIEKKVSQTNNDAVIRADLRGENGDNKTCHAVGIPHIIKSLAKDDFKKIRNNSIIVKGFRRVVNTAETENSYHSVYDEVCFCGKNLHSNSEKINIFSSNQINVENIKNQCLFILAPASEFMLDKNILLTGTMQNVDENHSSTLVVLLSVVFCPKHANCQPPFYKDSYHREIRRMKQSSIKTGAAVHFGSEGFYYGFGVHSSFKKINDTNTISLEQYASKRKC